jgi:hypothetical protein
MGKKKTFMLRLDPDVFEEIEKWAAQEFRSANGQIEWIISKALSDARRVVNKESTDKSSDSMDE